METLHILTTPRLRLRLMREAVGEVLEFGFEQVGLHKIIATHYLSNPASGKVLAANGMVKEAEMKDHYFHQGEFRSIAQYRMLREGERTVQKG